jgi:18S rRNA (adenine1779-N6/adenine1780-N6)-dimethyltransferase
VDKAGVKPTDVVLEIGPGTGNLTMQLLARAKKVIAIEVDPRMVLELQRRVAGTPHAGQLEVIRGDVMRTEFPYFDLCVANIPYQLSSPLTFKLLSHPLPFRAAVIMYQHEFAMRLAARAGDSLYCRLAVNAQLLARVTHLLKVGRNNFRPPPKVDSSVVRLEPRRPPPPVHFGEWDGFVRLAFGRKNRTLGAAFRTATTLALLEANASAAAAGAPAAADAVAAGLAGMAVDDAKAIVADDDVMSLDGGGRGGNKRRPKASDAFKARVEAVLASTGAADLRAAKLSQDEFMRLLAAFNAAGIHFAA